MVPVERSVDVDAARAERRDARQQLAHAGLGVRAPLQLYPRGLPAPESMTRTGAQLVELLLVLRDVRARAETRLLLAEEEREADRAARLHSQSFENARRVHERGDARAVVVGALCRVPRVEVRARSTTSSFMSSREVRDDVALPVRARVEGVADVERDASPSP
jgi:hypothetical protein